MIAQPLPPLERITEQVRCPLCDTAEFCVVSPANYPEELGEENLLRVYSSSSDHLLMDQLVACQSCNLLYLNPRVRSEIILDSYRSAVDPTFVQQNALRIRTFRRSLRTLMRRQRFSPVTAPRILDVGCAGGAFLKAATDLGFSGVGVEPSAWLCEYGRKEFGLDLRAGTLAEQKFSAGEFDLVTLWDVIEHLLDPRAVLGDIRRLLRDTGLLVVNFPNHASLVRRLLRRNWPFFLSVHLTYFTPQTISLLLERCGFHTLEIRPYWQTLELGYALKRASAYGSVWGQFEKLSRRLNVSALPFTYNMGQSMLVARKS